MIKSVKTCYTLCICILFISCNANNPIQPDVPDPTPEIIILPIVVHIVHLGEPIGVGTNLSVEQIESQIRVLNEDFRRKEGTRGFNIDPDGGDAMIEFTLATKNPDGNPTEGIVRIDVSEEDTIRFARFDYYASLSYWDPESYINVWTEPYPTKLLGLALGFATGPETDLLGRNLFQKGEPEYREGILVNYAHFGESNIESEYNLGRTLTHEMGHYLGLLHPWGTGVCETNDFVEDTPAVDKAYNPTCGNTALIENYMNYSKDRDMNVFTKGQIQRMHYVLKNSPYRNSLIHSPALN
ncbi:MAG: hypothetical protein JJ971_09075 [Balneolaceae bacterium]|nr:hypothetical protein [Balneolaceae bacterium]MBO6546606.1 hypothetical protein [Balneolaceae bacterium]MBO6648964.1 hypothetical protein [Balneolaceae bacterium]